MNVAIDEMMRKGQSQLASPGICQLVMKKGLERDQDGWAKLEEVEKILRRSRLQQHVGQLRTGRKLLLL